MIQLRLDVPAVERLIGGDTQVEVELRQGVVDAFCKRHINAVIKDKNFKDFLGVEARVAREAMEAAITAHVAEKKVGRYGHETWELRGDTKKAVEVEAALQVSAIVKKLVDEAWKAYEADIDRKITYYLNDALHAKVAEVVKKVSADLVNDLVKKGVEEKFKAIRGIVG